MAAGVVLLLIVCWMLLLAGGVEFFLNEQQIATDGSGVACVTDIGPNYNESLICWSESTSSSLSMYGNWYLDPNGQTVNTNEDHRIESVDSRGWNRDRETDSDGHRIVKLMRASDTAVDGRFTCDIDGDRDNPRALRILYPISLFLSFEVVSARQGTYTVTCVATGGRLSSSSLTGPGLPSSGVTLQAVGSVGYTGQNAYIGTSTTFSHSVGAMYDCTARNDVSSPRTTLVITGAGDPTLIEMIQTSATSVRVTWTPPSMGGAPVIGYIVHYTRGDGVEGNVITGSLSSAAEITGLANNKTYTISVEATSIGLSGESEEMTVTLQPPPQSVMVFTVEPGSVYVSWEEVQGADSYTVTFTQATGSDQCPIYWISHGC